MTSCTARPKPASLASSRSAPRSRAAGARSSWRRNIRQHLRGHRRSSHRHVDEAGDDVITPLRELAQSPRVVAIGETGLDYHRLPAPRAAKDKRGRRFSPRSPAIFEPKKKSRPGFTTAPTNRNKPVLFEQQLDLAVELGLNVVIHQRDAWDDTLEIMRLTRANCAASFIVSAARMEQADEVLALDHLVSFTGIVTFKNGADVREVAAQFPLWKFMVETDCPYLAPVPFRGKRCEPAHTRLVAESIASRARDLPRGNRRRPRPQPPRNFFKFNRMKFNFRARLRCALALALCLRYFLRDAGYASSRCHQRAASNAWPCWIKARSWRPIPFRLRNSRWAIRLEAAARRWESWKSRRRSAAQLRPAQFLRAVVAPAKFSPPDAPGRDPIVTRILWLRGREAAKRQRLWPAHLYSRHAGRTEHRPARELRLRPDALARCDPTLRCRRLRRAGQHCKCAAGSGCPGDVIEHAGRGRLEGRHPVDADCRGNGSVVAAPTAICRVALARRVPSSAFRSASTMIWTSSLESHLWFPIQNALRLRRIADQQVHLRRALVAGVVLDVLLPIQIRVREGHLARIPARCASRWSRARNRRLRPAAACATCLRRIPARNPSRASRRGCRGRAPSAARS